MKTLLLALLILPGPDGLYRKAEEHEVAGDDAAAAAAYEEFLARYPAHDLVPGARLATAWIHLRAGRPARARAALEPLAELEEEARATYAPFYALTRAEIFRAERNVVEAEPEYRAALAAEDPALRPIARLGLGLVLGSRGAHAEAEALLSEYLEAGADAREVRAALEGRARARAGLGLVPQALEDWERVARMEAGAGRDETAVREAALLLANANDPSAGRALADYLRRFPQGPGLVPARLGLLERARDKGDIDDAILHAREILRAAPLSFSALEAHLLLYHSLSDPGERAFHEAMIRRISPEALEESEHGEEEEGKAPPIEIPVVPAPGEAPISVVSSAAAPAPAPPLAEMLPRPRLGVATALLLAPAEVELPLRKALAAAGRVTLAARPPEEIVVALSAGGLVFAEDAGAEAVVRIEIRRAGEFLRAEVAAEILPASAPRRSVVLLPRASKAEDLAEPIARAIEALF